MRMEHVARIFNLCEIPFTKRTRNSLRIYDSIIFYPETGTFFDKKYLISGSSLWSLFCHIIDTREISDMQKIAITVAIEDLVS